MVFEVVNVIVYYMEFVKILEKSVLVCYFLFIKILFEVFFICFGRYVDKIISYLLVYVLFFGCLFMEKINVVCNL